MKIKKNVVTLNLIKLGCNTYSKAKVASVKNAAGLVSYKKVKGNKYIVVSKNGKVKLTKPLMNGTYKIKVKVHAKGDANHKAASKIIACKVKVKGSKNSGKSLKLKAA